MFTALAMLARAIPPPAFARPLFRSPRSQRFFSATNIDGSGPAGSGSAASGPGTSGAGPPGKDAHKPAVVHGQSESPGTSLRVRRARASDTPRVLSFVRDHARSSWPGVAPPPSGIGNVVFGDYISRTLAQGHTLLAEVSEQPQRRGRQLAGLALATAQSPWDATLLDRWADCVRCRRSSALLRLTATCLREPRLHEKYNVGKILQILIVVPAGPRSAHVSRLLAERALKRGKDSGYPLLRFDVTDAYVAEMCEKMNLTKEWQFPAEKIKEIDNKTDFPSDKSILVYSAQPSSS